MSLQGRDFRVYFQHYFPKLRPRENGEASVSCPFHDDRNPSLSLNVTRGIWYCFAGCGRGGIVEFEQRKNGGDHKEAWDRACKIMGRPADGESPEPVPVYDYKDETDKLLYQVVRLPGKNFRQRQPDGKGGWTWSLKGVRRVPYRLPEVMKAERVFIAEGEKDVETLCSLGLVATTNSGGAGKWRDEFAGLFKGKDVVILPDNDEPGRKHAAQVAGNLVGAAHSVKVVPSPGLEEHGDVSDWLAKGGENTLDKLLDLAENAPLWKPPTGEGTSPIGKTDRSRQPKGPVGIQSEETLPDGRLAEIVAAPHQIGTRFCIFRPGSERAEFAQEINSSAKIVKPAASEWVKGRALSLPTEPDFSKAEPRNLFLDIYDCIGKYFQGERSLIYITAFYIMLTWRVHQISEVPYLRVLGEPGSGKSRWLLIAALLSHRAVLPSVDFTESSLFRLLKAVPDATFAIDEADRKTALDDPLSQVLRAGMERDRFVWRSDPKGEGQAHEPQPFPCFGPKLLAAARPFRDDALESRIISFSLPLREVPEGIPVNAPDELQTDAQNLRNRLFAYRILNYARDKEFRGAMRAAADALRKRHMEGRTIQIGTGLLAVACEVACEPAIEACLQALQEHTQGISQGRMDTVDGVILEVLQDLRQEGRSDIALNDLHKLVCEQAQQQGLARMNPDGTSKQAIRPQGLSRMLRKQGQRFGVSLDPRLHGHDQSVVHLATK
jgi:hypothetical protein